MKLRIQSLQLPLRGSLRIAGFGFESVDVLRVEIEHQGIIGRGEASGLYYRGETGTSMAAQVEALRGSVEAGCTREDLLAWLPAGGARNALDCALWELESLRRRIPIWQLAGLPRPGVQSTTRTLYADTPTAMASAARDLAGATKLKLKLLGDGLDSDRVRAVRSARADALLVVDANQGLNRPAYDALLPALVDAGVQLLEQPFPVGREDWLDGLPRPVPIAADESVLTRADLSGVQGRVDVINIKLDKSGGLTEALALAEEAQARGFHLMVGCMCATSLSMAPAFLLASRCEWADIDGPLYLQADCEPGLRYEGGTVAWTTGVWGSE